MYAIIIDMHSLATVHVFGIILASPAVRYLIGRFHLSKLTGLAVDLVPLNAEGYFFLAQIGPQNDMWIM